MVKITGVALLLFAIGMGLVVLLIGRDASNNFLLFFSPQPHPSTLSLPTRVIFQVSAEPTDRSWSKNYDWNLLLNLSFAGGVLALILVGAGLRMILKEPDQGLDDRLC
ncbi:MAG: hypothetical protein OSB12_08940 [Planctomycetota bacterium]|nr:hypothetical protein [Planctomycetota bacterium]